MKKEIFLSTFIIIFLVAFVITSIKAEEKLRQESAMQTSASESYNIEIEN